MAAGVPLGLAVLAIAQMGVHLVFFIHVTTGPDNTNNVLALAFGVLIVMVVLTAAEVAEPAKPRLRRKRSFAKSSAGQYVY